MLLIAWRILGKPKYNATADGITIIILNGQSSAATVMDYYRQWEPEAVLFLQGKCSGLKKQETRLATWFTNSSNKEAEETSTDYFPPMKPLPAFALQKAISTMIMVLITGQALFTPTTVFGNMMEVFKYLQRKWSLYHWYGNGNDLHSWF